MTDKTKEKSCSSIWKGNRGKCEDWGSGKQSSWTSVLQKKLQMSKSPLQKFWKMSLSPVLSPKNMEPPMFLTFFGKKWKYDELYSADVLAETLRNSKQTFFFLLRMAFPPSIYCHIFFFFFFLHKVDPPCQPVKIQCTIAGKSWADIRLLSES